MINNPRIIARIDIKGSRVVKGIKFEGQKVYGDANEISKKYYEDGADEIILIDTVASLYERNSLEKIIDFATRNIFTPITVEGGIKSVDNAKEILRKGADKISINSSAIKNKSIIENLSKELGSQSVVLSIQAKSRGPNKWESFYLNGREPSGIDVIEWAKESENLGAGEIILSSVDKDGTEMGMDFDLIKSVSDKVKIPVIASSGCNSITEIKEIFEKTNVSAIAIGSSLHSEKLNISQIKNELLKR